MFSTPYYLSGKQARAWHTNKGEKATLGAVAMGGVAYGLTKPKYRTAARVVGSGFTRGIIQESDVDALQGMFTVGAAATGAYGAYHYGRAAMKNRDLKGRMRRNAYTKSKTTDNFDSSRQQHGNVD